ncbi:unnamed protein product [[Actinomadura] parvosata subsp. kistnae]|uniref:Uncharacterized protein n=1 Tax=[Actinomadura] parvosata subsp. kistnae TaxID=1909395 RepID=A0A1U9ZYC5_9ACTN|nr:hypothetical protein BKM31_17115 [Nonomuraea sp. ATCC 55076]SPL95749.1 unnamed protein product [Actinomadura parvosata subsp. kistnae]
MHTELFTLAQFARRVGISEGRARALWGQAGRLPRPDRTDADGRPLWQAATIDRWCRQVGRPVPEEAVGPWSWPDAIEPAPVVFNGEVTARTRWHEPCRVHLIVWDTPSGHMVQATPFTTEWVEDRDAARAAAQVLQPPFWQDAIIIVPPTGSFGASEGYDLYNLDAYRLRPGSARTQPVRRGLLALLKADVDDEAGPPDPNAVEAEPVGLPLAEDIQRVIGRPIPIWLDGSFTPETARRLQAFGPDAPFTIPDTVTAWPATRDRLTAAREWGLPERFPQAYALLARDARATFADVQRHHAQQKERGQGWYLAARPARPDWPVALEQSASTAAQLPPDLEAAAEELPQLRAIEAPMPYRDVVAEALYEASRELASLLRTEKPEVVFATTVRHSFTAAGPVVEQWRHTLTELTPEELAALRGTRRFARLLTIDPSPRTEEAFGYIQQADAQVSAVWRDHAGRLVVEFDSDYRSHGTEIAAEWPIGLPDGWTDATVIAADPQASTSAFALTPMPDGNVRVDPLPNPGDEPGYTWGYRGGGPTTFYQALVRCALGMWASRDDWLARMWPIGLANRSELWKFISTAPQGAPLRLPWPQVQAWAQQDQAYAQTVLPDNDLKDR